MTDKKISELPTGTAPDGAELVPLVQSSVTSKLTLTTIANWVLKTFTGFIQAGTGAVERSVQDKLRETVSVKDFGDATTDPTVLQAAIDAVGSGKLELTPDTVYPITTALVISNPDFELIANGATLDGSALAASPTLDGVHALKIEGSEGASTSITSDISEGAVSIAVADSSIFSVGDLALIYSTGERWPDGATVGGYKGALHKIRSIDSPIALTLVDGVFFSFASASGAAIKKISPVKNVTIRNLKVVMGGLNKAHSGFRFKYTENCKLIDCDTIHTEDTGVRIDYSYGGGVYGGSFSHCNSPADGSSGVTGVTGYGVCPSVATRDFEVVGANFSHCRHAVAGGGTYPAVRVAVKGNKVHGGRDPAYAASYQLDCHEDCLYWLFDGNHIDCASTTTGGGGILIRGQKTTVVNNVINNVYQYGIYCKNFDVGSSSTGVLISNNTITKSRLDGVLVEGNSSAPWSYVTISGNKIYSPGGEGVTLFGTTFAKILNNTFCAVSASNKSIVRLVGTTASLGNQCTDVVVSGNTCDQSALNGIRADYGYNLTVTGNSFKNTVSDVVSLTNCQDVSVSGNTLQTLGSTRCGVLASASLRVSVSGGSFKNTTTPSGDSCGVLVTGASSDVSVSGITAATFRYGVKSNSPANYITAVGVNARTCTVTSVDVSASANNSVAGNL